MGDEPISDTVVQGTYLKQSLLEKNEYWSYKLMHIEAGPPRRTQRLGGKSFYAIIDIQRRFVEVSRPVYDGIS